MKRETIGKTYLFTLIMLIVACTIGFYYFVNRVATKTYRNGYFVSINPVEKI